MSEEAAAKPAVEDLFEQPDENRRSLRGAMIVAGAVLALALTIALAFTLVMLGSMVGR